MRGAIAILGLRGIIGAAAGVAAHLFLAGPVGAQAPTETAMHLGVASCNGSNCHAAKQRSKDSAVPQNEYLIWSSGDKHRRAYTVLREARSKRIAANLGIPDPTTEPLCLNCHTDNVPRAQRGPLFRLDDGVGCEACHGGASTWLGVHISGASHQQNLAKGMYPTENALKRAQICLSCHFGDPSDANRFVTHRIMSAGHPRMGFELDTYTMAEPAHFVVDKTYEKRKGRVNDAQIWAVGQAVSLLAHADALLSPSLSPKGIFPELVLFDCQSCHHAFDWQRSHAPLVAGVPAGWPPLDYANTVMLRVIAARATPQAAPGLAADPAELARAAGSSWTEVRRVAMHLREQASELMTSASSHDFTPQDTKFLASGVVGLSLGRQATDYSVAEQATMGLAALGSEMQRSGGLNAQQARAISAAIYGLDQSFALDEAFRRDAFAKALREFQSALPR